MSLLEYFYSNNSINSNKTNKNINSDSYSNNNRTNSNKTNKNINNNIIKKRNININKNKLYEEIGILDPEGLRNNPLTNEPYKNLYFNDEKEISKDNPTYTSLSKYWSNFPMYKIRNDSIKTLYDNQVILVISGTGSGKTVLTPKFLLHIFNYQGRIAITNPKRIPTKENAIYAAKCLDVELGTFVGTKYRDSDKKDYSANCKLIYATDGWILQKLQKDPMLLDLDAVIIDEAHERGIQIDLLLLLLKELIQKRPKFKLIIMSATVNEKIFIDYFPKDKFKFDLINAGKVPNYPIEEFFLDKPINKLDKNDCIIINRSDKNYIYTAVDKIIYILQKYAKGDILVFFPGKGDTTDGCFILQQKLNKINKNLSEKIYCNMLTSTTDKEVQKIITNSSKYKESGKYTRKVIFATEVAESSITIDGIDFVIDSGLVNNNIFNAEKNMILLKKNYISKASHEQRKGRTGRTSPGQCYSLFTKEEYKKFVDYTPAPILTEDIAVILLYFLSNINIVSHINYPVKYNKIEKNIKINNLKSKELSSYLQGFIQPPPLENVNLTLKRFIALDIINIKKNIGKITDLGRAASVFELTPELAISIIASYNYKCRDDIINIVSLIDLLDYRIDGIFQKFKPSSKDNAIKKKEKEHYEKIISKWSNSLGDHISLNNIYKEFSLREYNKINRKTEGIIMHKKGNTKEWCKENYLNYSLLQKVKNNSRQINKNFGKVIKIVREKINSNKITSIFVNSLPKISQIHDENIIKALLKGFYINILKKNDKKYTNCFPDSKTTTGLAQDSLFSKKKSSTKYAFYSQLKSIFGRINYSIVSKISPEIINELKTEKKEYQYIKDCLK